ncbi:MAG TPA: EamA family transporter [Candidatus Nitrosocosmicus sp.]|nr:EamA family transporter [Candidatus Nitrosocosmicus sp.]
MVRRIVIFFKSRSTRQHIYFDRYDAICRRTSFTVLSVTTGELQKFHGDTISRNSFISLIYLITVGSAGWVGFFWILRYTSATLANTFAYVSPVIAIILGWVILDEVITIQLVVATMIIMIGVVLIANRGKF